MGRPQSAAGMRPVVVGTRLSEAEAAFLDEIRRSLSRSEMMRWLLAAERKRRAEAEAGMRVEAPPTDDFEGF